MTHRHLFAFGWAFAIPGLVLMYQDPITGPLLFGALACFVGTCVCWVLSMIWFERGK